MNAPRPIDPPMDDIEPGRRLIRVGDKGMSLAERVSAQFHKLTWRTPLHKFRLRGRYPLKLLAVPFDPVMGDAGAGVDILDGWIPYLTESAEIETLDFAARDRSEAFTDHLQSFAFLRDLAAAAPRGRGAPIAELVMRRWLAAYGADPDPLAWRPDLWGRRILNWAAHAPLILSSADLVYRSAVLNALARGARHLDQAADKAPLGLARVAAWAGVITAGLLIPGGEPRRMRGEMGLARALAQATSADGGIVSRSPAELVQLIELLSQLTKVYEVRREEVPQPIAVAVARGVPALLGVLLGDGKLSSWQGSGPLDTRRIETAIAASGVRARPLRQSRDWGFQRLSGGATTVVVDCAPPPASRLTRGGCASTLAFEMSDGPRRLIVNCGGDRPGGRLPPAISDALRTTAAHSTLIVADSNSTAIHADGSLGRGVAVVELERQEQELASRIEASHDGYVRRFGFTHQRNLSLSSDGRELRGEDVLLPAGRRRGSQTVSFAIRFHLGTAVEPTATADGLGALLRLYDGALWQFRCRGGTLAVEESIWIDERGRPKASHQLIVSGEAPPGGTSVSWLLKRVG